MGLSIRNSRLRRIEARLRQVGIASAAAAEDSEATRAIEREVLAYELNASALLIERLGGDLAVTAADCRDRMTDLPPDQRQAVFDLAREVYKPLAGCSAAEGRQVLEGLISAMLRK